jgi:hypothetical protein
VQPAQFSVIGLISMITSDFIESRAWHGKFVGLLPDYEKDKGKPQHAAIAVGLPD